MSGNLAVLSLVVAPWLIGALVYYLCIDRT
jgi:hypothetical protein